MRQIRGLEHPQFIRRGFLFYEPLVVVPPDAVNVALLPLHIVNEGEAEIVGEGIALTVTVCELVAEHPAEVPVKV